MATPMDTKEICTLLAKHFGEKNFKTESLILWHDRPKTSVYRFTIKEETECHYYFKIYKNQKSAQTAEIEHRALTTMTNAFINSSNVGVIKPIAYFPQQNAFITEEYIGEDLNSLLKKLTSLWSNKAEMTMARQAIDNLVDWFAIFQKSHFDELQPEYSLSALKKNTLIDIDKAIDEQVVPNNLGDKSKVILKGFYQQNPKWDSALVTSNGDAKLWNFLCAENGDIRALDFVAIAHGLPAMDFARIWVGLNWLKNFPNVRNSKIEILQNHLIEQAIQKKACDRAQFEYCRLCVMWELTAFYSGIRKDKYRKKLRNILFFPLIRRYFRKTLNNCIEKAEKHV